MPFADRAQTTTSRGNFVPFRYNHFQPLVAADDCCFPGTESVGQWMYLQQQQQHQQLQFYPASVYSKIHSHCLIRWFMADSACPQFNSLATLADYQPETSAKQTNCNCLDQYRDLNTIVLVRQAMQHVRFVQAIATIICQYYFCLCLCYLINN